MGKFTTKQLQSALIGLYNNKDADSAAAYQMTFEELHSRMGDDAFDAWCDSVGI